MQWLLIIGAVTYIVTRKSPLRVAAYLKQATEKINGWNDRVVKKLEQMEKRS